MGRASICCPISSIFFSPVHYQYKTEYHTTQVCEVRYIVVRIVGKTGVQFNQCISDNKVFGFYRLNPLRPLLPQSYCY